MQQNMQLSNGSQLVISGLVEWQDAHYRIPGDLVFDPAGGELRIKRCAIVVAGDVVLGPNSLLHISDSELSLDNAFPRQHEFRWEGGHLHTERTVVGGNKIGGTVRISPFWLNSGYWFAKDTTVRYSGGIQLGWGRAGYHGLPGQRGGTLRAVGLSGGESADALHLSGWGNAELSDSVFAIGLSVYLDGPQATTSSLRMPSDDRLNITYGDPAVHQGVTHPLPVSPYRLKLSNTQVPRWHLRVVEVTDGGPHTKLILDDADNVYCQIDGHDITGAPVLTGPWGATPPGLPSTTAPGHHPIPPGNSVRIANFELQAGNREAQIRAWSFYLRGGSNITITGASRISEMWMANSRVNLIGTRDFNAGLAANKASLHGDSHLSIEHGALGSFHASSVLQAHVEVFGCSTVSLTNCRISESLLVAGAETSTSTCSGMDLGTILLDHPIVDGTLTIGASTRPGAIQLVTATAGENTDLQNLGFENWTGGALDNWHLRSATTVPSSHLPPGSSGSIALRFQTQGSGGSIEKRMELPQGSWVDAISMVDVTSQSQPSPLSLRIEGLDGNAIGVGNADSAAATSAAGWQLLRLETHTVTAGEQYTSLAVTDGVQGQTVAVIDDMRVHISNWWDNDNLGNLGFEDDRFRDMGIWPGFWTAPDGWSVWQAQCTSALPRATGNHALRLVAAAIQGTVFKELSFTKPGDQVTVTGYIRGTPGPQSPTCWVKASIGEGNGLLNRDTKSFASGTAWNAFSITHTVPARPAMPSRSDFTRIVFECFGGAGNAMFLDDLQVSITR